MQFVEKKQSIGLFLIAFFLSSTLSGCQTLYSSDEIGKVIVDDEKEQYVMKSKCSYVEVTEGEKVSDFFENGVCFAFRDKFIFRSVNKKNYSLGISHVYPFTDMKSAGITESNILGGKQFQIKIDSRVIAIVFRNENVIGVNNDEAENFLKYFKTKGIDEKADARVNYFDRTGGCCIFVPYVVPKR